MNRMSQFTVPAIVIALLLLPNFGCVTQKSFASPEDAAQSLVTAARAHDTKALEEIFGSGNEDLLYSGDPVDDANTIDRFVSAYDEKHTLVTNDDGTITIVVGNDEWPMPIPIMKKDSG